MGARQTTAVDSGAQNNYAPNAGSHPPPPPPSSAQVSHNSSSPIPESSNATYASSLTGLSYSLPQNYLRFANNNRQTTSNTRHTDSTSYQFSNSDDSSPDNTPLDRFLFTHLFALRDIKCPSCHKSIPSDNVECHLIECLSKPLISYNEDILTENKGECSICLEDLKEGDVIARLPCLCIYHKSCIDEWFQVKRSCPEHPND